MSGSAGDCAVCAGVMIFWVSCGYFLAVEIAWFVYNAGEGKEGVWSELEGVDMRCQVYPFKHQEQTCVMFPSTTPVDELPKAIRHELDTGDPWPQVELIPGLLLGSVDEAQVMMDIRSDGYHIQHLRPGEAEMMRRVA